MAIALVDVASNTRTNGVDVFITLPSHGANDLVILMIGGRQGNFATALSGQGFTQLSTTQTGGSHSGAVAYKINAGTDLITFGGSGSSDADDGLVAVAAIFSGVDNVTPIDVTTTAAADTSGFPDSPSITPASDNCAILSVVSCEVNDTTVSAPSSYTLATSTNVSETNSSTAAIAYRFLSGGASSAQDPALFSMDNGAWVAFTVALRPAAEGQPYVKHLGGVPFTAAPSNVRTW